MNSVYSSPLIEVDVSKGYNNPSYFRWLKDHTQLLIANIIAIMSVIGGALSVIINMDRASETLNSTSSSGQVKFDVMIDSACVFVSILHIIFGFMFILRITSWKGSYVGINRSRFVMVDILKDNVPDEPRITRAQNLMENVRVYFIWFWVLIVMLYLTLFMQRMIEYKPAGLALADSALELLKNTFPSFITYTINSISSLVIFGCYAVFYSFSSRSIAEYEIVQKKLFTWAGVVVTFCILLWPITAVLIFTKGIPLISHKLYDCTHFITLFFSFSGIINSVVLAMLISRFDEKLICLKSRLIFILYAYAAIQPLICVFELNIKISSSITLFVMMAAFFFKINFYSVFAYCYENGRFLNYMLNFEILEKRISGFYKKRGKRFVSWLLSCRHMPVMVCALVVAIFWSFIFHSKLKENVFGTAYFTGVIKTGIIIFTIVITIAFAFLVLTWRRKFTVENPLRLCTMLFGSVKGMANANSDHRATHAVVDDQNNANATFAQLNKFRIYFILFWLSLTTLYVLLYNSADVVHLVYMDDSIFAVCREYLAEYLIYLLTCISSYMLYSCFVTLYCAIDLSGRQNNRNRLRIYGISALTGLVLLWPIALSIYWLNLQTNFATGLEENLASFNSLFYGIAGYLNSIVLCLLIALIDDKIISIKSVIIFFLYMYAALQPMLVVFNLHEEISPWITVGTLLGVFFTKILFFYVVAFIHESGRLYNYFVCYPRMDEEIERVFSNTWAIYEVRKSELFYGYNIYRDEEIMFIGNYDLSKDTMRASLNKMMKPGEFGVSIETFVSSPNNHKFKMTWKIDTGEVQIGESISFKTKRECEQLIAAFQNEIAFAKVNTYR